MSRLSSTTAEPTHATPARRRRRLGVLATAAALVAGVVGLAAAPASAARTNTKTKPVIFVHGFQLQEHTDCRDDWANAKAVLAGQGFKGPFYTWGYYAGDTNCDTVYPGNGNHSIYWTALQFAKYVFTNFTSKGIVVDVVAHSMGGLIVQDALTEVQHGTAGYPGWLYIEDVATLGTPFGGSPLANACTGTECQQLRAGSPFLNDMATRGRNPQGANGGTDWSIIGSTHDAVAPSDSALNMPAGHKYRYVPGITQLLDHSGLRTANSGTYQVQWAHVWPTVRSGTTPAELAPLFTVAHALETDIW